MYIYIYICVWSSHPLRPSSVFCFAVLPSSVFCFAVLPFWRYARLTLFSPLPSAVVCQRAVSAIPFSASPAGPAPGFMNGGGKRNRTKSELRALGPALHHARCREHDAGADPVHLAHELVPCFNVVLLFMLCDCCWHCFGYCVLLLMYWCLRQPGGAMYRHRLKGRLA